MNLDWYYLDKFNRITTQKGLHNKPIIIND